MESTWVALERTVIAVSLGEITTDQATERMCAALAAKLGGPCTVVDSATVRATEAEVRLASSATAQSPRTLVLPREHALETADVERIKRLFELLFQSGEPFSKSGQALHQLRNRLAGVLANIEFVEMTMTDAEDEEPGPGVEQDEVVTALGHAVTSCREMAKLLRALSGL